MVPVPGEGACCGGEKCIVYYGDEAMNGGDRVKAALELKIPVVIIQKEKMPGPETFCDIGQLLEAVKSNNIVTD